MCLGCGNTKTSPAMWGPKDHATSYSTYRATLERPQKQASRNSTQNHSRRNQKKGIDSSNTLWQGPVVVKHAIKERRRSRWVVEPRKRRWVCNHDPSWRRKSKRNPNNNHEVSPWLDCCLAHFLTYWSLCHQTFWLFHNRSSLPISKSCKWKLDCRDFPPTSHHSILWLRSCRILFLIFTVIGPNEKATQISETFQMPILRQWRHGRM